MINKKNIDNFKALPYLVSFSLPISVPLGLYLGGLYTFLTLFIGYFLLPILDILFGRNDNSDLKYNNKNLFSYLKYLTWLAFPTQLFVILFCLFYISFYQLSYIEYVGLFISAGISSGAFGITAAHELIHQRKFERMLSRLTLFTVCYPHFCIEHVHGHHINVATPKDPASAQLGQSVYNFFITSLIGSYISAWGIEGQRLSRKKIKVLSLKNVMIQNLIIKCLMFFAIWYFFSFLGLLFFICQSLIAVFELEVINYIEHYGLRRKEIAPGIFEQQNSSHTWNSNHALSNYALFNLPLHSDHHQHAGRRFFQLRHDKTSPQLPFGYSVMVMIALVPSFWKKMMDPLVNKSME